jgi:hypothetical protein
MSIDTTHSVDEDVKTAMAAIEAKRPVPRDVEARLDQHAAEFRERMFRQHGYMNSTAALRQDREAGH